MRPARGAAKVAGCLAIAAGVACSGCALATKKEVVTVRYFTPERVKPRLTSAGASPRRGEARAGGARSPSALRLGRVTSGANLRERIAYRDSAQEIGYYEDQRWTERPETFVRRELGRTLFEERGFERVSGGAAPELDVELLAFDELRLASGGPAARVQLKAMLWHGDEILFEETFTVDRRVAGRAPKVEDFVAAMGEALDEAAAEVAARVAAALGAAAGS